MNKPQSFVTLDKYKNDLSRQISRDKLLIEHLEKCLKKIDISQLYANELIEQYKYIIGLLREPLDFWFTAEEWSQPLGFVSDCKPVKFSDSDELWPAHFEFEGER